jgi:hypothetical protein
MVDQPLWPVMELIGAWPIVTSGDYGQIWHHSKVEGRLVKLSVGERRRWGGEFRPVMKEASGGYPSSPGWCFKVREEGFESGNGCGDEWRGHRLLL